MGNQRPDARIRFSLTPVKYAPYIQCGAHTITTGDDGTFSIDVESPTGKPADYAAYTIGPYGTGFYDDQGTIAHRWDTSNPNQIRFRLWEPKRNAWAGRAAIFGSFIAAWNRS